jgi:hypothetical protein
MHRPQSFLVTYSIILLAQFLTMANSQECVDSFYKQKGFCASAESCHHANGVTGLDLERCTPVSFPFSTIEANLFKPDYCCFATGPPKDAQPCASYLNQECGDIKGYGEMSSICCLNSDDTLEVLYCAGGISLTSQPCRSPFSCIQHMGITSGKKRNLAPYAQCEIPED